MYRVATLVLLVATTASAQDSLPHLRTRWAASVDPDHPLPEYPRPQMVRSHWQSLNGRWEYAVRDSGAPRPSTFDGRIVVPFPIESQLSGVRRAVNETQRLWYRRRFRTPRMRAGDRLLLHFGAVDWESDVYVNGTHVLTHRGGYDPFTADITDALRHAPGGDQELVVRVWDPTDAGDQPRGKQVRHPHSIWYSAVTGIWQTVWLETVPRTYIDALTITPNLDDSTVRVTARVVGATSVARESLHVAVLDGNRVVARGSGRVDQMLLRLTGVRAWSPSDPFLYGLRVRLSSGDSVESYVGMRKIALMRDASGTLRLALNNRPLFQYGLLDQGWWPDGLYTAPTDEALRSDIGVTKRLGFNVARKHVKVEPARWYYHADRLGLLVWQDMPSADNKTAAGQAEFAVELEHMVDALRNHPSIVMWVPFNEGWGQHDTERYVAWLRQKDPSRLVDNATGWTDMHVGDVRDIHSYPGPALPLPDSSRALVLGEFGGLGLPLAGHTWLDRSNWGYRRFTSLEQLGNAYRSLMQQLRPMIADGLAAAIYTQTTDVEIEVNGVMTYDRAVIKVPSDAPALHARLYDPPPHRRIILASSRDSAQTWRYTEASPAADWMSPTFDDGTWKSGAGGFGSAHIENGRPRTPWTSPDLWIRRTFEVRGETLAHPYLLIHHDEDAAIYINGVRVDSLSGYTTAYTYAPLDSAAVRALHSGRNTIAVHVHNTRGEQYIDIGLIDLVERHRLNDTE